MIKYNPQYKSDGTENGALTSAPSGSIVFDVPGKAIWVKGVKLLGTDHTYSFDHDTYINLTNTPGTPEDIKIGININTLRAAIDTTYDVVTSTVDGLAPKFNNTNSADAAASTSYRFLGLQGSTLKWYTLPHRNIYVENTEVLAVDSTNPLKFVAGTGIQLTWDSTNKRIQIVNSSPDLNHNTDYQVGQYLVSDNADYRLLFKRTANDTEETGSVRYASTILYNPSTKQLKVDGNRVITAADIYVGATSSANATAGLVPAATSAQRNLFLRGDGTWVNISTEMAAANTWRPIKVNSSEKLGSGTDTGAVDFVAGTGITLSWDATNKKITITNSAPDQNHNTDRTGVKLTAVTGTKKTDDTVILANSAAGLNIQGGTNKFSIGDGTNYIEVPITPSFTVTDKAASILTSATTLATINGTDITAKVTVVDSSPTLTTSLKTIATIAGVEIKAKITNYNTDENVKLTDNNNNLNSPILLKNGTGTGQITSGTIFADGVTVHPSSNSLGVTGDINLGGTIYFGKSGWHALMGYNSTYSKYGIWYNDSNTDQMTFSASGNADTAAGADFCINGAGDGTLTARGNLIWHAGNLTNLNLLTNGPGYLTESTLPYRLKALTSSAGYVSNPDNARESGFWYSSANGPTGGDCELLTISHAANSWCHQLCFKFSTKGSTGTGYDSKDLWTRMYSDSSKSWTDWYTILTSGNWMNFITTSTFAAASHTHSFMTDITNRPFYDSPYSAGAYTWSYNPLGLTGIANIHGWSFKDANLGTDIGVIQWYLARESTSNTCINFSMDGNIQVAGKIYAAGGFVGNASTASKWQTARTLTIGNTGKSVDGSANVSWSLSEIGAAASSHTHSWSDISGIITDAKLPARLKPYGLDTSDHRNIDSTCLDSGFYWVNTGTLPINVGDAGVITVSANSSYGHQLAFKYSGNGTTGSSYDGRDIYTRIYKGGTWQPWYTILTSGNYTAYAAPASHTHAWPDIIGIITEAKLPYRLREKTNQAGYLTSPDACMSSGFWYCSGGSPINGDCHVISIAHNVNGWGHQLCFKFGGTGSTGASQDGKQLWTRIYNESQGKFLPWYEILTSATYSNYALPLTGGTLTGLLILNSNITYPLLIKGSTAGYGVINFIDNSGTWKGDFGWLNDSRGDCFYMAGSTNTITLSGGDIWYSDNHSTFKKWHIWHQGNLTNLNQLANGPGYLTLSTLPYRLLDHTNMSGYVSSPNNFMVSGFAYSSGGSPNGGDCHIMTIAHNTNGWCHLLCFKFGGAGLTGSSHDGKLLWTRMYHQGNGAWTAWYEILTSATALYYSLPITGGTLTGTLNIKVGSNYSNSGGWCEGIRLYSASNGWTTFILGCTGDGGTNANAWSFHTYGSTFYLANNGSSSFSNGLSWTTAGVLSIKCSNFASFNCNLYAPHYYESSDIRLKHDISPISQSIRRFRFNNDDKLYYGFIAQELETLHPELVDNSGEYKTVNYNSAICYYIAELENKVQELENKLKMLENRLT